MQHNHPSLYLPDFFDLTDYLIQNFSSSYEEMDMAIIEMEIIVENSNLSPEAKTYYYYFISTVKHSFENCLKNSSRLFKFP